VGLDHPHPSRPVQTCIRLIQRWKAPRAAVHLPVQSGASTRPSAGAKGQTPRAWPARRKPRRSRPLGALRHREWTGAETTTTRCFEPIAASTWTGAPSEGCLSHYAFRIQTGSHTPPRPRRRRSSRRLDLPSRSPGGEGRDRLHITTTPWARRSRLRDSVTHMHIQCLRHPGASPEKHPVRRWLRTGRRGEHGFALGHDHDTRGLVSTTPRLPQQQKAVCCGRHLHPPFPAGAADRARSTAGWTPDCRDLDDHPHPLVCRGRGQARAGPSLLGMVHPR
jgi:hypothetical protein